MNILGHSAGTALVTLLLGVLAFGCAFSGVWGLLGRDVSLPDSGPLESAAPSPPEVVTTFRGQRARLAGVVLLAFALGLVVIALRVWRADQF